MASPCIGKPCLLRKSKFERVTVINNQNAEPDFTHFDEKKATIRDDRSAYQPKYSNEKDTTTRKNRL